MSFMTLNIYRKGWTNCADLGDKCGSTLDRQQRMDPRWIGRRSSRRVQPFATRAVATLTLRRSQTVVSNTLAVIRLNGYMDCTDYSYGRNRSQGTRAGRCRVMYG